MEGAESVVDGIGAVGVEARVVRSEVHAYNIGGEFREDPCGFGLIIERASVNVGHVHVAAFNR